MCHWRGKREMPPFAVSRPVGRLLACILAGMLHFSGAAQVLPGDDVLLRSHLDLLRGKRVGLITNQSGRLSSGVLLLDTLVARGVNVAAIYAPEHGFRGLAGAGDAVCDSTDPLTGIPLYSLYGTRAVPTSEMLADVDVLVYDIQDVGVRFYTYISTMVGCMRAAAAEGIPFIVLDRPNPLGGLIVDGPVLVDTLQSFVGAVPVPTVYGLTCGELAAMANGEGWLSGGAQATLTVIPMQGWKRSMRWDDTRLSWVPPSPNMRTLGALSLYPVSCYLEATNISEGRGTNSPFQTIGAPFCNAESLMVLLSQRGFQCRTATFTPGTSKFSGRVCQGVQLIALLDETRGFAGLALDLLSSLRAVCGGKMVVNWSFLARLAGSNEFCSAVKEMTINREVPQKWRKECESFRLRSERYMLYRE